MCVNPPELIRVQLQDVPETVTEDVRRTTGDYTIPIVVNDLAIGSGTLVQIDQWPGILTAQHVVKHPTRQDLQLDYTGYPERRLRTSVGPFAHDLSTSTNEIQLVTSTRASDEFGPDVAFIALPEGPFLHELKARKSFYNLTLRTNERRAVALDDVGFFALCGFPAVRDFQAAPELGFTLVNGLNGYAMFTGPQDYKEGKGWDWYELGVSQGSADDFERNLGGVSGGAVWRVELVRRDDNVPGTEFVNRVTLAGVAFFQMDDRPANRFFVRSHGPISIYDRLVELVRTELLA